ncbi:MAG: DUF4442 domain-containing protein [Bacteriovoracia bacterium]
MNFWPPFLGAGIRLKRITPDFREIDVEMKLRFWNQNYVRTQFGGSIYAMVDPFYMLMLLANLGDNYIVWDKAATIRFKKPGKGRVHASFRLTQQRIDEIKSQADTNRKFETTFYVQIFDSENNVIAEVDKLLYIRRKEPLAASS